MATQHLISIGDFCVYHEVEHSFITDLNDAGLITIVVQENTSFIEESDLQQLEKLIRLHHELEINIPGIAAIAHLLQQAEEAQEEMRRLRNLLIAYE